jgi:hypothetical protein
LIDLVKNLFIQFNKLVICRCFLTSILRSLINGHINFIKGFGLVITNVGTCH